MDFPYKGYKSTSVVALWPTCSFLETWVTQTLKSKTESPSLSTAFLLKLGQERSLQTICSCEWCNTAQGHSVPGKRNCLWMGLDKGPPRKHTMKNSGREILCQLVPKTVRWTRRAPQENQVGGWSIWKPGGRMKLLIWSYEWKHNRMSRRQ